MACEDSRIFVGELEESLNDRRAAIQEVLHNSIKDTICIYIYCIYVYICIYIYTNIHIFCLSPKFRTHHMSPLHWFRIAQKPFTWQKCSSSFPRHLILRAVQPGFCSNHDPRTQGATGPPSTSSTCPSGYTKAQSWCPCLMALYQPSTYFSCKTARNFEIVTTQSN